MTMCNLNRWKRFHVRELLKKTINRLPAILRVKIVIQHEFKNRYANTRTY